MHLASNLHTLEFFKRVTHEETGSKLTQTTFVTEQEAFYTCLYKRKIHSLHQSYIK